MSGTWSDAYVADDLTISGGTVNNSVIGGTIPAAGTFTDLTANTNLSSTGNTTLGDAGTDTVTVNGALQIASGVPGAGKVLTSDAAGNATWQTAAGGGVFENAAGVVRNTGTHASDDFVFGSSQLDDITPGVTWDDSRMFFDKDKGAFRAGNVSGAEWNVGNVGSYSAAMGNGTRATGTASTAMGKITKAFGDYSTAMGNDTTASGGYSTAMGYLTYAIGAYSTAMGGITTSAGDYSVATGRRAKIDALHDGSFLFADSTNADFNSAAANEFAVRASGGVRFADSAGANKFTFNTVTGEGTAILWTSTSDRNAKENFAEVNPRDILSALVSIPIETWNYKTQEDNIRHIGPMAQDFHAAFSVGENNTSITTIDADGVALAAIQGLHSIVEEQNAVLEEQKTLIAQQQALIENLKARIEALEAK